MEGITEASGPALYLAGGRTAQGWSLMCTSHTGRDRARPPNTGLPAPQSSLPLQPTPQEKAMWKGGTPLSCSLSLSKAQEPHSKWFSTSGRGGEVSSYRPGEMGRTALPEVISWSSPILSLLGNSHQPCQATFASWERLQKNNKKTVHVCVLHSPKAALHLLPARSGGLHRGGCKDLPLPFTALRVKVHPEKHLVGERRCREGAQDLPVGFHRGLLQPPPNTAAASGQAALYKHSPRWCQHPSVQQSRSRNTLHSLTLHRFPDLSSMAFLQSPLQPH